MNVVKAPPLTEAQFQQIVLDLAHALGYRTMHVRRSVGRRAGGRGWQTTTSIAGWPDLVLIGRGRIIYRELKTDTGKVSLEQEQVLQLLRENGGDASTWRPVDLDSGRIQSELTARGDAYRGDTK